MTQPARTNAPPEAPVAPVEAAGRQQEQERQQEAAAMRPCPLCGRAWPLVGFEEHVQEELAALEEEEGEEGDSTWAPTTDGAPQVQLVGGRCGTPPGRAAPSLSPA